jgi:hypothetical protein
MVADIRKLVGDRIRDLRRIKIWLPEEDSNLL